MTSEKGCFGELGQLHKKALMQPHSTHAVSLKYMCAPTWKLRIVLLGAVSCCAFIFKGVLLILTQIYLGIVNAGLIPISPDNPYQPLTMQK